MSLKQSVVVDSHRCICQKCQHANTCEIYTKYKKLLDMIENIDPNQYIVKITSHIRKCNNFLPDKEV